MKQHRSSERHYPASVGRPVGMKAEFGPGPDLPAREFPGAVGASRCPGGVWYVVEPGDTIWSIAQQYQISTADLIAANPRLEDPAVLNPGDFLCVPAQQTPSPGGCPSGFTTYVIRAGDTYYRIAKRLGTRIDILEDANPGVDPTALAIGQTICIPRGLTPAPGPTPQCPAGYTPYTIRAGDTFYGIAQRLGTTVDALVRANPQADPNRLFVGQQICVPGASGPPQCPSGFRLYTVQEGDTIATIVQGFRIRLEDLLRANPGLSPDQLRVGQRICVPNRAAGQCPQGFTTYSIQPGDTFYAIAQRLGTTVAVLRRANSGVNPDTLQIGQQICVPQ